MVPLIETYGFADIFSLRNSTSDTRYWLVPHGAFAPHADFGLVAYDRPNTDFNESLCRVVFSHRAYSSERRDPWSLSLPSSGCKFVTCLAHC